MASNIPQTYKAVQCPTPGSPWEVVTRSIRDPEPNEILIRVHASGVCNSDHFVKDGSWPGLKYPRVPGHEVVGRIAGIGSDIKAKDGESGRFKLNGLVGVGWNGGFCNRCDNCRQGEFWTCKHAAYTGFSHDGGHAEYVYAPETSVITLPEEALQTFSYAELAPLFCAGATVFDAIRTTKWCHGDICIVQGIGGLGHLAVQYAAKMGLKVYAVSSGSSKRDLALSIGAYDYIDSSSTNAVEKIQSLGGAKVIICTAPYADQISAIIPAVAVNGTVTLVSAATDTEVKVWNLQLNMNRATIRGWSCGAAPDMEKCVSFSTIANVKPIVTEHTLEEFSEAYEGVMKNTARFRNVVVFP
ncbi:GroES-like protein [Armillaria solidipes]|uniref:GroES-like protein n=1 Tax=Armillaria solidipes TaxID=1076256 RepID=A0A2H3AZ40_9AGAR|nr:GroES-like protein [Armillaria solidipes]